MANQVLSQVLSQVGWDSRFAIPVANSENKALLDEIQTKQKERANVDSRVSRVKERIGAMTEHFKNVRQELLHIQGLCRAREKESESELHLKILAEREAGRLRQEISQLESELGSLREKKNSQQNQIFKVTHKLDELRDQLNWDQQTLETWLDELARRNEDTMAIAKYSQRDDGKIRELILSIDKLTLEAGQKRKILDKELTETMTAQIGLDTTVESLRQAHVERQALIGQWENIIEQMRKRDQDLQQSALLLAEVNQAIRERKALLKEKQNFLSSETENNKECDKKILAAERKGIRLQQELNEEEQNRARLKDELESLKTIVDRTATDVQAMMSHLTRMKKELNNKSTKLEDAQLLNATLEEKLQAVTEKTLSVEERAEQLEQLLRDQEQHIKEFDAQMHREREILFQKNQELQTLQANEKKAKVEISGSRAALSNLDNRLRKQELNSLKQEEIAYNQTFQIKLLEGKLDRMLGNTNTNSEEMRALEKRTAELSEALEEKKKTSTMLSSQLKKLQHDVLCVRKDNEKTAVEKSLLTEKLEELNIHNDNLDKELKKLQLNKQDSMVEDNLLRLEVKRLRDLLFAKADGVFSLEKKRLELQTAMKERQEEVRLHREMLFRQLKVTEQERLALSIDLHERLSEIDKTRKRYEVMTIAMAVPEGEEDKSHAYYIIKAAQEKEELQSKGDGLDANIQKKEKELKALENTLHVLNDCNSTYRKSLNKVSESSPEYQEKLKLETQKRAADEKHRYKRRQINELQEDIKEMSSTLNSLLQEEAAQMERNDDIETHIVSLNKEVVSQHEKLDRATKQSAKLAKEIRSDKKSKEKTFEERDIELKELRDCNKTVNKLILEVREKHPDLQALLQMYFMQAGIALPSPASTPSSRQSSKASSARSSVSIRSSTSSTGSSTRSSAVHSPGIKTVDLGLELPVSSPPQTSPASSRSSSKSSQIQSP